MAKMKFQFGHKYYKKHSYGQNDKIIFQPIISFIKIIHIP